MLVVEDESAPFQDVNLVGDGNGLLVISHCPIYKKRPALVRWSSGSVAGSVGAKVVLLFEMAKQFEGKRSFEAHFYVFFAVFALELKENLPVVRCSEANGEAPIIDTGFFLFCSIHEKWIKPSFL